MRTLKLQDHIRDEIGKILHKELDLEIDALVTVTRVEIPKKPTSARIYISVYPEKFAQEVIENIKKRRPYFQSLLKKKTRTRIVPSLNFELDKGSKAVERIEKILGKEVSL